MMNKYEITENQLTLIKTALEKLWYSYHGDGELFVKCESITELESSLNRQYKAHKAIEQEMRDTIHNCYWELYDVKPEQDEITAIAEQLDESIKLQAGHWGWDDTEIRDCVYRWIKRNTGLGEGR
jgi:hypothetical protein